jgi:hypothetical protein
MYPSYTDILYISIYNHLQPTSLKNVFHPYNSCLPKILKSWINVDHQVPVYEEVSIISWTGAAISIAAVVLWCNGRC